MSSFQGIWVPVVTPFQDGAIDFSGLHRLVSHLLAKHVAGIMVCTTTGEAASLSRQEQLDVLDASSVPIILYDIPSRTGATFEQATLLNIVEHERIVAIKDCGGNLGNTLALLASGKVAHAPKTDRQPTARLRLRQYRPTVSCLPCVPW